MGFRRSDTMPITFPPGHELHGLNVTMRRLSINQTLDIADLTDVAGDDRKATDDLLRQVAANLVSWDLEDGDGVPVPLPGGPLEEEVEVERDGEVVKVLVPAGNYAVVLSRDMPLINHIVTAWMDQAVDVPAPLEQPSSAGAPSEAVSVPMDDL